MDLIFGLFIGIIGLSYSIYGKKSEDMHFFLFGIVMMFYPYIVQNLIISILLGIVCVIAPFYTRKFF